MHTHLCLYFISYSSYTFPQFFSGLPNRQHTCGYWAHTKVEEVYYTGITISFQNCQGPLSKVPNITSTLQSIMKVLMTKTLKTLIFPSLWIQKTVFLQSRLSPSNRMLSQEWQSKIKMFQVESLILYSMASPWCPGRILTGFVSSNPAQA